MKKRLVLSTLAIPLIIIVLALLSSFNIFGMAALGIPSADMKFTQAMPVIIFLAMLLVVYYVLHRD